MQKSLLFNSSLGAQIPQNFRIWSISVCIWPSSSKDSSTLDYDYSAKERQALVLPEGARGAANIIAYCTVLPLAGNFSSGHTGSLLQVNFWLKGVGVGGG